MTEPTNLSDAIGQHFQSVEEERRARMAAELRDWQPDPELEALEARVAAMRAAGERHPLGHIDVRLASYRNRRAAAAAFAEHGVLPDGTTPPAA